MKTTAEPAYIKQARVNPLYKHMKDKKNEKKKHGTDHMQAPPPRRMSALREKFEPEAEAKIDEMETKKEQRGVVDCTPLRAVREQRSKFNQMAGDVERTKALMQR